MILFLLIITKWYVIVSLTCLAGLGVMYIHDRIKYGEIPVVEDNEEL
jgi:hypothetical protein